MALLFAKQPASHRARNGQGPSRSAVVPLIWAALAPAVAACASSSAPTSPQGSGLTFAQVAAGGMHTCAVTTQGAGYCWGDNESGQLGTRAVSLQANAPQAVTGGLTFSTVVVGYAHTCGLTREGAAYCWGDNEFGLLGAGTSDRTAHPNPALVSGGLVFQSLAAGGAFPLPGDLGHTCGLTAAGKAYCWGSNAYGDLGIGTTDTLPHPTPVPVTGGLTFQSLSAGPARTCGLTAGGEAYCWGAYSVVGDTAGSASPTAVPGGLTFTALRASATATCALTADGSAFCWGANGTGTLGNGDTVSDAYPYGHPPAAVLGGLRFESLGAGMSHVCGITAAGAAYCWGYDAFHQLGTALPVGNCHINPGWPGSSIPWPCSPVPVPAAGGLAFASISAGNNHTCGITTGKVAYCWGNNAAGQLGDSTTTMRPTPVRVAGQSP
jgi:alpha-tubulin suppressor-like RCC1 family protein